MVDIDPIYSPKQANHNQKTHRISEDNQQTLSIQEIEKNVLP